MNHTIVVDLGYGDAGKGTVVDWLTSPAEPLGTGRTTLGFGLPAPFAAGSGAGRVAAGSGAGRVAAGSGAGRVAAGSGAGRVAAVVRFNGGAQAAHNVVAPDGRHHTFAQFGAGTLHGVPTHLSRHVVVDPLALAAEAGHLRAIGVAEPFGLLTVDAEALLVTPWHRAANQVRERRRGAGRHGSCGMGIGETMAYALDHPDAPRAADARSPGLLRRRLAAVRDRLTDTLGELDAPPLEDVVTAYRAFGERVSIVDGARTLRRLLAAGACVFEGAQGVLLDEWFGWHPYTTWSTTTFANADELLAEAGQDGYRLGVVRTYTTRHGNGPLVTENAGLTAALPDRHNGYGRWQGGFRVGHFDAVAHRYAVEVAGGVHGLAVTHLDVPPRQPGLGICRGYAIGDRTVRRIPPGTRGDLRYQEVLTAELQRARPVRIEHPENWPAAIGEALDAPVVLESRGPGTADKSPAGPLRDHARLVGV